MAQLQDAAELLQNLSIVDEENHVQASDASAQNQQIVVDGDTTEGSNGASPEPSRQEKSPAASDYVADSAVYCSPNGYPQQPIYYGCYDGAIPEYEEFPQYVNFQGAEIPSTGVYGDNCSVLYNAGYGYSSQMPYGPYTPAGATISSDQMHGSQQFQYSAHLYQQPLSLGTHYMPAPSSLDVSNLGTVDYGSYNVDFQVGNGVNGNSSSQLHPLHSTYGTSAFPLPIPTSPSFHDPRVGVSATWPDPPIYSENHQRAVTTSGYATSLSSPGYLRQNVGPMPPHIMPQGQRGLQQWPPCGNGSSPQPSKQFYFSNRSYSPNNNFRRVNPVHHNNNFDIQSNACNWSRPRGRGPFFNVNNNISGNQNVLNEQSRGPRTLRSRHQQMLQIPVGYENTEDKNLVPNRERYNQPEFQTNYPNAKFFIIKSYSEDDIHKSIKYNIWASTPNGNKKLNAAYQEAQGKTDGCPVFLFFSVNSSGQFCGVGEMIGEVDFTKSVNYWQQEKWTGSFPVKWIIIKDVPNSQLRHITIENNDNKPVTNSRDTQEVSSDKGTEMLNIFKNYVCQSSILDDFSYYEARQIEMQMRKAQQHVPQQQQEQETSHSEEESGAVSLEHSVEDRYDTNASFQETAVLTSDSSANTEQCFEEAFNNLSHDSCVRERIGSYVASAACDDGTKRMLQINA